jgi:ArsR family transcriptional regulator, arsenate/arsenite/antimonite-responsive transcriptional repressor
MTGDISYELPLSRTTVKQHLTELKNAGLVQGKVDGVRVNYCLNPGKIKEMIQITSAFLKTINVEEEHRC